MLFGNTRVLLKWPCNYSSLNSLLWIWMFGKATQSYLTVQISYDFIFSAGQISGIYFSAANDWPGAPQLSELPGR